MPVAFRREKVKKKEKEREEGRKRGGGRREREGGRRESAEAGMAAAWPARPSWSRSLKFTASCSEAAINPICRPAEAALRRLAGPATRVPGWTDRRRQV